MLRPHRLAAMGAALATITAGALVSSSAEATVPTDTTALRDAVTTEGVMTHLREFQRIADKNGDNRASGEPGHQLSADYVAGELSAAGYDVTRQPFEYDLFRETATPVLEAAGTTYTAGTDFVTMEYSGAGDVTAPVTAVDVVMPPGSSANTSTSGCEATDFAGFPAGDIALVQRGTCTFRTKVDNAAAAGASGVVIFNEGQPGRTDAINGTLSPPQAAIPAVGTSFAVGEAIYNATLAGPTTAHLAVSAQVERKITENVIADSSAGRADRTVVVGSHLDSVLEGPGIEDNGTGSAASLEIALQMAELGIEPTNRVRFAYWGAEESGLLGSQYYVDSLTKGERKDIALNLNYDMIGSPNYGRFVYDGDGSAFGTSGPAGSAQIEQVFADYFTSQGLVYEPTGFDGRSDYDAFVNAGIPAGGLFTGAEVAKTEEQVAMYGGVAGVSYDPCYHQACDSLTPVKDGADKALYGALGEAYPLEGNVNLQALDEMSDAAAHATLTFAMSGAAPAGTAQADDGTTSTSNAVYLGSHERR